MMDAERAQRPEVARRGEAQDDHLATLAARLAGEDFAASDQALPEMLRAIADEQVRARRLRSAVHLQRAALLLERQLASTATSPESSRDA